MKKICFDDNFWLTNLVLSGDKTMTRRIIPLDGIDDIFDGLNVMSRETMESLTIDFHSRYQKGDVVAVAQSYKTIGYDKQWVIHNVDVNLKEWNKSEPKFEKVYPAYANKLYVKAEYMPHHIEITGIKIERLQDISDEDCIKEGIELDVFALDCGFPDLYGYRKRDKDKQLFRMMDYNTPKAAFKALICSMMGEATWKANPWVFAYEFKLID